MTPHGSIAFAAALLVALGVLVLALRLLKQAQAGTLPPGRGLPLRILQRATLGPKQGVALVQVGERVLVVSIAEAGAQLLTELAAPAAAELLAPAPGGKPPAARPWPAVLLGRLFLIAALACLPVLARAQAARPAAAPAASAPARPSVAAGARPLAKPATPARPATPAHVAPSSRPTATPAFGVSAPTGPQVSVRIGEGHDALQLSGTVGLVVFLGALTLLPVLFLLMTSFTRILIVLHFLRSALGTQTTPPGQLLVALAVLLTGVVMNPVLQETNRIALQPYLQGQISQTDAYQRGVGPFREFMLANTREKDLSMFAEMSHATDVRSVDEIPTVAVVSAFVTSELRTAFQMGFVIYLPFVVVDVIVASVLMSLGMFMLPPMMISLPVKLLLFVLADGWTLVVQNLVASYR